MTYVKKGETYFLPYGLTDLQDSSIPVKVGDRVRWSASFFSAEVENWCVGFFLWKRWPSTLVKIVERISSLLAMWLCLINLLLRRPQQANDRVVWYRRWKTVSVSSNVKTPWRKSFSTSANSDRTLPPTASNQVWKSNSIFKIDT